MLSDDEPNLYSSIINTNSNNNKEKENSINIKEILEDPEIKNITLKNKAIKIQKAYRKHKIKLNLNSNQNNENLNIDDNESTPQNSQENINNDNPDNQIIYIGRRDSRGLKQGFGIEKFPDGGKFRGIFTDNKLMGWGIFEHGDGDTYQGQYINNCTNGYGEYSHANGAIYYGNWIDDKQFGIGYEIWNDSSKYTGE